MDHWSTYLWRHSSLNIYDSTKRVTECSNGRWQVPYESPEGCWNLSWAAATVFDRQLVTKRLCFASVPHRARVHHRADSVAVHAVLQFRSSSRLCRLSKPSKRFPSLLWNYRVGDSKVIRPVKNLALAITTSYSLEDLRGPGLTWSNLKTHALVKQKLKAAVRKNQNNEAW